MVCLPVISHITITPGESGTRFWGRFWEWFSEQSLHVGRKRTPENFPAMDQFCIHCGNPIAFDDAFCPGCGQPIAPPKQVDQNPSWEAKAAVCTHCGSAVASDEAFCPTCGQRVEGDAIGTALGSHSKPPPPKAQPNVAKLKIQVFRCDSCNASLVPGDIACTQCGKRFAVPVPKVKAPSIPSTVASSKATNPSPSNDDVSRSPLNTPPQNKRASTTRPNPPPQTREATKGGLATAIMLNILLFVGVTCLLSFGAVSLVKAYKNKDSLSGTYATQDMINLQMTNGMGLTFYPNGTFTEKMGGISQDTSGTYKLSGNTLIIDPSDPVRAQGNDPVTNGFLQAMNGTVSDDRRTINFAGGVWIKTN